MNHNYLQWQMLSGKVTSLFPDTSKIFKLNNKPIESGSNSKRLEERCSSWRFSKLAIESGITCFPPKLRSRKLQTFEMPNRSLLLFSFNPREQQFWALDKYMLQWNILCKWQMEETWSEYNERNDAINKKCQRTIGTQIWQFPFQWTQMLLNNV